MKDETDLKLESLFASASVADDGFSAGIEKRIRRRLWVNRLALPVAVMVGGGIAVKPLVAILTVALRFVAVLPNDVGSNLGNLSGSLLQLSSTSLPQLSTVIFGGMLAFVFVMLSRMLED